MWNVDPKKMCRQHLLGEHVEMHMFAGTINRGISVRGYIEKNLFEPSTLEKRHDELVVEMESRGYNHKSPMPEIKYSNISEFMDAVIDGQKAHEDLVSRCELCKK